MYENLWKIIEHYGINNQQRKLEEEVFELQEAIMELQHYEEYACDFDYQTTLKKQKEHIAEELADVLVMLEQFRLYYGLSCEEIAKIFWSKVDRQLERIKNERKNKNE